MIGVQIVKIARDKRWVLFEKPITSGIVTHNTILLHALMCR